MPAGRYEPPPNWRPRLIGIAIVGVFVLAIAAAVMTSR
jgi:hypothetical protein